MENINQSISVFQNYFNAFQQGNMDDVLNAFHKDCLIVSVRDKERSREQLHGTYRTKEQAKQFLQKIVNHSDPKDFVVEKVMGDGNIVFANGWCTHKVKATGKMFISDWVQRCIIENNKIKEYRFYEDSAAFVKASMT